MFGVIANLVLNIMIVVLLAATIAYCWLLNRRIKILQDSRGELAILLKHFDESTQRAAESIVALQTASKKIGENIQFRIDKANYLIEDLSFMIDKGNKLANQMEAGFAVNRARDRVLSEDKPAPSAPVQQHFEPVQAVSSFQDRMQNFRDKTSASLESVIEKVVVRKKAEEALPERQQDAKVQAKRNRSRSEQEVLDLIKAGIKG